MRKLLIFLVLALSGAQCFAQQLFSLNIPTEEGWNRVEEGDTIFFQLSLYDSGLVNIQYRLYYDDNLSIDFDSLGNFLWIPSYDLVDRVEESKVFSVLLEAVSEDDLKFSKEIQFEVVHKNRPPLVEDLPVLYVKQYSSNKFHLHKLDQIKDPDGDPIVFRLVREDMPQGATLSELGIFTWNPSRNQFRNLKNQPAIVRFIVQDQPEKQETIGEFKIAPTELDLPPEILMVPSDPIISVKEDDMVNLNLYVTDPNGDEDIIDVGFVSNNLKVPKEVLKKNTNTQWEFKWRPGYEFIDEEGKIDTVTFTFFALDQTGQKTDKKLTVSIADTENIEKKDRRLYHNYRNMMLQSMDLIAHLDNNQKSLNKQLKKAKKGKKNRSIISASLGALTGVSPVFLQDDPQNYVTGVGGTAVLTLGTLEATEVLGRSKDDILDKLRINIDIRNQIQAQGDQFARKYALKTKRRDQGFNADVDKLKATLNNKKLILLELPADWENPKKSTDKNIRKTFPDFNNEGYAQD